MGSKSNTLENEILEHLFKNTAITGISDDLPASTTPGSLYVSLHTGTLDDTSVQNTTEAAYTGYLRIAVPRSVAGWIVTGNSVSPAADIDFGECTAVPGAALTHFAIGKDSGTAGGDILYWGELTPDITMAVGVIPRVKTTSAITED
jgi:hypothetical protein